MATQEAVVTPGILKPPVPVSVIVRRVLAYVILGSVVVWLGVKLVQSPRHFLSVFVSGLNDGMLYALIALGYTLVYGIIELINFAHGDLFMLATIFAAIFLNKWLHLTHPTVGSILAFVAALILVMAVCAGINVLIELLAYRRLRKAPKLAPLITAVGVSFILQFFGQQLNGSAPRQWDSVLGSGQFVVSGVAIPKPDLVVFAVTIPLLVILSYIVTKTRAGRAMRATAQDQDAARLMGINVNRTISFTFALGGALAGAAGLMFTETVQTTRFDAGFRLGLYAFTAAVLGGIGNLTGAVVGGIFLGLVQGFNEGLPLLGQVWSQTPVFALLILLLVFKPEGIFGTASTEKV